MNATSIAPPMSKILGGRPLAYVVTCPLFGSTRKILPVAPSVTYSAPPGPMLLPEPLAILATNCAVADNGMIITSSVAANNSRFPFSQPEHGTTGKLTFRSSGKQQTTFFITTSSFSGNQKDCLSARIPTFDSDSPWWVALRHT